jgi:hypothetical protein
MRATDPDRPEIVASRLTEPEAALVIQHLREAGIEAHLWGTSLAGVWGEGVPRDFMKVVVREEDADRARALLEELRLDQPVIDWDRVDVGEPEAP